MWGCDYLSFSGGWGSGIFPLLIWLLIIALAIYAAMWMFWTRTPNTDAWSQDRIDSMQILKARFANGEITQEEFAKMKHVLSQS
ncbi:MAG: SHOCT domain-containing protein [Desulforhopalus sp.]|nr:SHOCT domain-containing protein [Desulforhopalus sp.]